MVRPVLYVLSSQWISVRFRAMFFFYQGHAAVSSTKTSINKAKKKQDTHLALIV